jgi:hypothetical protein
MIYTIFNKQTGAVVIFTVNADQSVTVSGDMMFAPIFQEAIDQPFPYFGPAGYEPITVQERPELLPAFLMRYSDHWQLPKSLVGDIQ